MINLIEGTFAFIFNYVSNLFFLKLYNNIFFIFFRFFDAYFPFSNLLFHLVQLVDYHVESFSSPTNNS